MFSDGYSNAAMGPTKSVLARLYPTQYKHGLGGQNASLIGAMGFAGMVLGQLAFGVLSDKWSRKYSMFVCTGIIFVFSILCACAAGPGQTLFNCLIAFRFLLGIGIGGEYPSGSVTAAESTEAAGVKKGQQQRLFIWATNTMLDLAFAIAWVRSPLTRIFGDAHLRAVWRGVLLLGAIPPLVLLIARVFMHEPQSYLRNNMRHTRIPYALILRRYWARLLAVSVIWFIYDWITYPFGMYSDTIVARAAPNASFAQTLGWGCLVNAFYVPGTIAGSFLADWIGPKYCLITGLVLQAVFGFALSGAYDRFFPTASGAALTLTLVLAFGEVGPGNNLGLLASKAIGPTAARGQLYGIAAAIGKVGAFIGSYTFPQIQADMDARSAYLGHTGLFYIGAALAGFSAIIALCLPNIKPDAMADEDVLFREYLAAHGFDVSRMGEPGQGEKRGELEGEAEGERAQ
ncbi:uncharacterized protein COLE_03237 [Cutaneotrichosporon oleaginosum]|uniref:uncharacterized protein n=1 Tax=Cutaneotrichosporon oleaginosum TaxID=879819 RepID=UPI001320E7C8|nr:hypothetical protein COLE_03237 [Cutaneotrichosporon oleaginosum]